MREHSGRHNGDDFESTVIALRSGYTTKYTDEVIVETIVPQTPKALFTQRRRWELGSLETYGKERKFLLNQGMNLRTGSDTSSSSTFTTGSVRCSSPPS